MSYKTKYKEALKAANLTEDSLLPKVKKQLSDVKALEQALIDADEDEQEDIAASLEALDNDLCKKIARNEQMKATVVKMQAARGKKKEVTPIQKKAEIEPIVEPRVTEEEPKEKEVDSEEKGSGVGLVFGVLASVVGLAIVGKWQKWF